MREAIPARARAEVESLDGGPAPARRRDLVELVLPFGETVRGVTFRDGSARTFVSYHDLAVKASAAAEQLRVHGVREGDPVALTLGNDVNSVVALLGIWAAGAVVVSVPVAPMRSEAAYARHFSAVLRVAGCRLLVSAAPAPELAALAEMRVIPPQALCEPSAYLVRPNAAATVSDHTSGIAERVLPTGVGLVQFTSGSISAPKGIVISADKLAHHAEVIATVARINAETDRFVSWLPLYHDMGLITMFLMALATRTDFVLMPPESFAYGPARWLRALSDEGGTVTAAPDFAYRIVALMPQQEGLDLSRVRIVFAGAERLNYRSLRDFLEVTEPYGLDPRALTPCYGLAESVVGTTTRPMGAGLAVGPDGHVRLGKPVPGLEIQATAGLPAGPVRIRGTWVLDGYLTAEGFQPVPEDSWHDTGDDGFIDDGELHVIGRRGEMIASGGRNIFAEDIEAAVYEAESGNIRTCAAFRLQDADQRFGLMVELPRDPRRDQAETVAWGVRVRAAVNEAVGVRIDTVLLVRTGTIPRTTSGKVQRGQCRTLHASDGFGRRLLAVVS